MDHLRRRGHLVADLAVLLEEPGAEHGAPPGVGHHQVLLHGQGLVDGWSLELAPHAQPDDLVLAHPDEVVALELDLSLRGARAARDEVQHRGLAGATRAFTSRRCIPARPSGKIMTTAMNSAPMRNSHSWGKRSEKKVFPKLTTRVP